MTSRRKSLGCGLVKRMRSIPETASTPRRSSAKLEQPLPLRLRVAAADGDDRPRALALQLRCVSHMSGKACVGLLTDRAGVEDDHVRLILRRCLAQPELLEQTLDPLGVVGVHLA